MLVKALNMQECPLCRSFEIQNLNTDRHGHCLQCDLKFLYPEFRLSYEEECQRYRFHQNNVDDPAYQKFAMPLVKALENRLKPHTKGLDFGCGSGPVAAHLLKKRNFSVSVYDPVFFPDKKVLNETYDFVYAIEVVEHFFDVSLNFSKLIELAKPKAWIGIMTELYDEVPSFENWYYIKDPTHVAFYSRRCCQWISKKFMLSGPLFLGRRLILFQKV